MPTARTVTGPATRGLAGNLRSRRGSDRRTVVREATQQQIDLVALDLLREGGAHAVTVAAVARAMGMTAPALYRYVRSRSDLLTRLIAGGFDGLAERMTTARDAVAADDHGARMVAVICAWREWALREPALFTLLFGSPVPDDAVAEEARVEAKLTRCLALLWEPVLTADAAGALAAPRMPPMDPAMTAEIHRTTAQDVPLSAEQVMAGHTAYAMVVGALLSEQFGLSAACPEKVARGLFLERIRVGLWLLGMPAPRTGPLAAQPA